MKPVFRLSKNLATLFMLIAILALSSSGTGHATGRPASGAPSAISAGPADQQSPAALGTVFTFQGMLKQGGSPVTSTCDFIFSLWTASSGPSQIGGSITRSSLAVNAGLFIVDDMDFGDAFNGDPRWLEVSVRCPAGSGSYTTLSPRLALRPTPYALYTNNSDQLDGRQASDFLSVTGGTLSGNLTVNGLGTFNLGGGQIAISTPGGLPGMIMFSPNGHRRDLVIRDTMLQILASNSSAAPANTSGITVDENGYLGVGTYAPQSRLDVHGDSTIRGLEHIYIPGGGEFSFSTPGGWPGLIMFSPNGHRRDVVNRDTVLQILTSNSSAAPANTSGITIDENGSVGIGTYSPQARLDVAGTARASVVQITGGSDLAEPFDVAGPQNVQPGLVMVIDAAHPGQLAIAARPYDRKVAGCVSGANGVKPGLVMQQEGSSASGAFPVALSGRVYCWADASYGAIQPGDLLTTSSTPGHLMLAGDFERAHGAILGKAMGALPQGRGLILVLVTLQ